MNAYQQDLSSVARELRTDLEKGLSAVDAAQRLQKFGANTLPQQQPLSIITLILRQLLSPLMFVLIIAAAASVLIGELSDAIVIGIAALINVVIGFIQEYRADRAAQALRSYEVPQATVIRDGTQCVIQASQLVPGDRVFLQAGTRVPADIRLSYVNQLYVEEALLTGESEPIVKTIEAIDRQVPLGDRTNMAHAGTYVLKGKAEGIVVATGSATRLGDIAQLIMQTEQESTLLQKQIERFSWFLGALMGGITIGIIVLGFMRGYGLHKIITIGIALAVAAIPEGLLVAVTVILAIGMQRMLKRKALVRHLIAAETLGSVSVICTDKTGTLTQGRMAVIRIVSPQSSVDFEQQTDALSDDIMQVLQAVVLNNDAYISSDRKHRVGTPTELALFQAGLACNIAVDRLKKQYPRIREIPFSSQAKYMVTVHSDGGQELLIVKGAAEVVLSMCTLDNREQMTEQLNQMVASGLRVLAVAQHSGQSVDEKQVHGLTFLGLLGLEDPLRPHAAATVEELKKAGIHVVLVTGDHAQTAHRIAQQAGVATHDDDLLTGVDLDDISYAELVRRVTDIEVFARVSPRHKIRIVQAWREQGHTVAMTGDGVNDAPALKAADIGIALGSGSEVSHETADMVLLDNNLSTISAAVRQGRIIFDNIRKVIVYLMVDSFSEIVLIIGALLGGLPMPLTAVQILWINLVTDGFPHIALTMEPGEQGIMNEPPRPPDEPIMNYDLKVIIFVIGIITDIGLFGLFLFLYQQGFELTHIQTMMFAALGLDSLLYVFSVRTMRSSIFATNPFENKWLTLAVCAGGMIQLAGLYVPFLQKLLGTVSLDLAEWGLIAVLSLVKILSIETVKQILAKRRMRAPSG